MSSSISASWFCTAKSSVVLPDPTPPIRRWLDAGDSASSAVIRELTERGNATYELAIAAIGSPDGSSRALTPRKRSSLSLRCKGFAALGGILDDYTAVPSRPRQRQG